VTLPLLMVLLLGLVFGEVLAVRWRVGEVDAYAAVLFSGLLVHFFVAECLTQAPTLVLDNAHYVKSTKFPLQILPWTLVLDAGFHLLASVLVLFALVLFFGFEFRATLWALPLVLLPLLPLGLGLGWLLGSLSVYFRDLKQVVGVATTGMLLLSPVLYPLDSVPAAYRIFYLLNPLTLVVENLRDIVFHGVLPSTADLLVPLAASALFAVVGRWIFARLQPGFYDVL